ncbi:hypothetical protein ACQKCU_26290 [Heyndrickxia sporothermodurans]
MKDTKIYLFSKAVSRKRNEEIERLINLHKINSPSIINKLCELIEFGANKEKPKEINWSTILIFFSIIYTSFIGFLMNELVKDFKFQNLIFLILLAIMSHGIFLMIKNFVEAILFWGTESKYNFSLWVVGQLKEIELN